MLECSHRHVHNIVITAIISAVLSGCAQPKTVSSLTFLDPNFKRCVIAQGKENIQQITSLRCSHFNIRDAREIRYLTDLNSLDLSSNQLIISTATACADAGFWPVIRLPSTTI